MVILMSSYGHLNVILWSSWSYGYLVINTMPLHYNAHHYKHYDSLTMADIMTLSVALRFALLRMYNLSHDAELQCSSLCCHSVDHYAECHSETHYAECH